MSQTTTSITTKSDTIPNNQLSSSEFNDINDTVNHNSSDAEARLVNRSNDDITLNNRLTVLENGSFSIQTYVRDQLPTNSINGNYGVYFINNKGKLL